MQSPANWATRSNASLTSPPGKAVPRRPRFLAKLLELLRCSVTIASGQTRSGKRIRVSRLAAEEARQHMAVETRVKQNEGTAGAGARAEQ